MYRHLNLWPDTMQHAQAWINRLVVGLTLLHELDYVCGSWCVHLCKMKGLDKISSKGLLPTSMVCEFLNTEVLLSNFSSFDRS